MNYFALDFAVHLILIGDRRNLKLHFGIAGFQFGACLKA